MEGERGEVMADPVQPAQQFISDTIESSEDGIESNMHRKKTNRMNVDCRDAMYESVSSLRSHKMVNVPV